MSSYTSLLSAAIRRGVAGGCRLPPSASAIVSRPATGSHILKIDGYTNTKSILATGESVTSRKFTVGGHNFVMRYYPNGFDDDCADSVSLFVDVAGSRCNQSVAGHARFSVLDHAGKPVSCTDDMSSEVVDFKTHFSGQRSLIKREELERSENILKDDCFAVRCDLTVMDKHVLTVDLDHEEVLAADAAADAAVVPPSDLHRHLAELLWSKEGADIVIELGDGGEMTFHAHRWVLAARSPVLKAELSALPSPATLRLAAMENEAFKALLHFIYTDMLPEPDTLDEDAMARRLLAAADTYKMERLKLICEDKLRSRIAMGNVAVTLALAEQHHCRVLKEACIEFLSSPGNLKAAMATDDFEHLKAKCPSVLTELVMKQLV